MKKVLIGLLALSMFMFLMSIIRTRDSTEEVPRARPPTTQRQGPFVLPHFHPKPREKIDLAV